MSPLPKYAMTYVVGWRDALGPGRHVIKVGRAWRFHRVQLMTRTGGQILICARGTDATWEREALRELDRWFPRAFNQSWESERLLFMGRGWTECYEVGEYHLQLAIDLIFKGFARGNDQGVNEAKDDNEPGLEQPGVPACPRYGEADGARPVDSHRPARPAGADTGADSGGHLPGQGSDRPGRRAPADARRGRIPDDLPGGRVRVDQPEPTPPRRHAVGAAEPLPGPATRQITTCRGCGGRGCERAGAGAGERVGARGGGRACERVGGVGGSAGAGTPSTVAAAADGCSAAGLSRASAWSIPRLRPLRHGPTSPRSLAGRAALRRADGAVRGRDGRRARLRAGSVTAPRGPLWPAGGGP